MKRRMFLPVLLSGCQRRGAAAVRVATHATLETFVVHLCESVGHFLDNGLTTGLEVLPNGQKIVESLLGGSSDVGYTSYSNVLHAAGQGRPLKAFFVGAVTLSAVLVVSPAKADHIRSLEDLKGRAIGVGGFGTAQHQLLTFLLSRHGLTVDDVRIVPVGLAAAAIASIEHGHVDAAFVTGGAFAVLKKRAPKIHVLVDPRTREWTRQTLGTDAWPNYSMFATADWIARNPDTTRRLAAAMLQTLRWSREHTAGEVLSRLPAKLRSNDAESDLEALRVILDGATLDGRMPPDGPETVRRTYAGSLRTAEMDLTQTYTNDFLPEP